MAEPQATSLSQGPATQEVPPAAAPEDATAAAKPEAEGEEAEYFVDDEASDPEVVMLMCILNQGGSVLQGRRIWRRLAVPADFSLMELHVALQNAFDWEDTHLHDFNQPVGVELLGGIRVPPFPGHGPTDLAAFTPHMLDLEALPPHHLRTFRAVVGVKDDPAEELLLAKAEDLGHALGGTDAASEGGSRKGRAQQQPAEHCLVYVEHSHPHAEGEDAAAPRAAELGSGPTQVLEERAFVVGAVASAELPVLVYEYDFRMGYEVHLFFEGRSRATEGVNYPTCLAGQGASPAEDGDDMDDQGNLLPSYTYDDFAVLDVLANFEKTFEDSWPLGPGAADKKTAARCYLCRYNRECGRRRECNGRCCDYCHKHPLTAEAGRLLLSSAHKMFEATANRIKEARRAWAEGGKCDWVEEDGQPCVVCQE